MSKPTAPQLERLAAAIDRWVAAIKTKPGRTAAARASLRQRRIDALYRVVVRAAMTLGRYPGNDVGSIGDVASSLDEAGAIVTAEELIKILESVPARGEIDDNERRAIIEEKVEIARARCAGEPALPSEVPSPVRSRNRIRNYCSGRGAPTKRP